MHETILSTVISNIILMALAAMITYIKMSRKQTHDDRQAVVAHDAAMTQGLNALLRDRLLTGYRQAEEQGYLKAADRENLEHMYKAYTKLGGNGVVRHLHEKIIALPLTNQGGH